MTKFHEGRTKIVNFLLIVNFWMCALFFLNQSLCIHCKYTEKTNATFKISNLPNQISLITMVFEFSLAFYVTNFLNFWWTLLLLHYIGPCQYIVRSEIRTCLDPKNPGKTFYVYKLKYPRGIPCYWGYCAYAPNLDIS